MPSLREIRGHIRSVTGIAQVVHAMEAVSSVTSHRLQERIDDSVSYAETAWRILARLAALDIPEICSAPAFERNLSGDRTCLLFISSNRGMAGSFDQSVLRLALEYIAGVRDGLEVITVGSQGHDALLRRGINVVADWSQLNEHVRMDEVSPIATYLLRGLHNRTFDRAVMVYTQFRGALRHRPTTQLLLPVELGDAPLPRQFYYEPGVSELVETLLPRAIQASIHLALLESLAAEHAARAVAMRSASNNARDLADHLRLTYNKSRQQAITAEMNEVSSALTLESGS